MLARTAAFDNAVRNGGRVVNSCAIQRAGSTIASLDLMPGASIRMDDSAANRRSFSGELPNTGIAPHLATDTLAPFTIEAVISTGLVTPAAPAGEMLQEGVFVVNFVQDDSTGLIRISGPDRAFKIAASLNDSPYAIAAGTPLDTAILGYLDSKYPGMVLTADSAAHTFTLASPVVYQAGTGSGDPWANCQGLAAQFGRELFIDNLGQAVLRPIPDPTTAPIQWVYVPGTGNLALSGTHTMDTGQGVHNKFVVSGEGTGVAAPVTASAAITDKTSPIYPDPAGFGRRPGFLTSPHIITTAQAFAVAQALLNKQPGLYDQIAFTAVPHPALEPGDVVSFASSRLGMSVPLVLASWQLQIDLQAPMQCSTRTAGAVAETVLTDLLNATIS